MYSVRFRIYGRMDIRCRHYSDINLIPVEYAKDLPRQGMFLCHHYTFNGCWGNEGTRIEQKARNEPFGMYHPAN